MSFAFSYDGQEPERLDRVIQKCACLPEELKGTTRAQIKNWIDAGYVLLSGVVASKSGSEVKPGEQIILNLPERKGGVELSAYDFPLEILFEDQHLLVINKPAGISMHPGAGNYDHTLVNAIYQHFLASGETLPEVVKDGTMIAEKGVVSRPGIVHRLDKDTTGLVVVAKTLKAHAELSRQFAQREVGRSYQALVFCTQKAKREINLKDSGRIETQIGRNESSRVEMAVRKEGGRHAATNWKVVERMRYACLVELRLETGRTHQIRVHMEHIGCPVIGDRTYGNFSGLPPALRKKHEEFGRQALHAWLLEITHPESKERLRFSAEMPADMKKLVHNFRSFPS